MKSVAGRVSVVLALALVGCATGHPLDCATGFVAWNDCPVGSKGYVRRQQLAIEDQQKCAAYGFQLGTDGFAQCMMTLDQHRDESNDRLLAGILASHPAPPPTTTCTTSTIAGQLVTQCN